MREHKLVSIGNTMWRQDNPILVVSEGTACAQGRQPCGCFSSVVIVILGSALATPIGVSF